MIIWQGLGAYALVIPFFLWFGAHIAAAVILGAETERRFGPIISGIALLVSAWPVYVVGKRFAARRERVLVDKATGEEFVMREQHTMFFVPMRYWAIAGAVLFGSGVATLA